MELGQPWLKNIHKRPSLLDALLESETIQSTSHFHLLLHFHDWLSLKRPFSTMNKNLSYSLTMTYTNTKYLETSVYDEESVIWRNGNIQYHALRNVLYCCNKSWKYCYLSEVYSFPMQCLEQKKIPRFNPNTGKFPKFWKRGKNCCDTPPTFVHKILMEHKTVMV